MTTQDPLTAKLVKARDTVARLCDYLAARRGWKLADGAVNAGDELVNAARATDDRLRTLILAAGAVPLPPARIDVEALPAGVLDVAKIERFAAYLRDLEAWFAAQGGPPSAPAGVIEIQRTQALIARVVALVDELALPPAEPAETAEPVSGQTPSPPQGPPADEPPEPRSELDPHRPKTIVLDDTDARPMIQEFRGVKELTPECKESVRDFLAAWGIEQSPVQRKKLLDRLVRWIGSAPDGQVLVLKIKTASEPFEPYPAYVSRDLLTEADAPTEP